jgi:hypothetical protein
MGGGATITLVELTTDNSPAPPTGIESWLRLLALLGPVLTSLLSAFAALCAADAVVRGVLSFCARRAPRATSRAADLQRPLVLVPARGEGDRVGATLASVQGAAVVLLLDGADAAAEAAGVAYGARVVVKEPAGPTKAAALAWLAREHRATIEAAGAVMVLDVGSTLAPSFFERFAWPEGADVVQAVLSGDAGGAADSERLAQSYEDRGREALGWNVRLRGTGSAFRAQTFLDLAPRLATRVEDLEASLLLHRQTIRLAPADALVFDQKPESIGGAGAQRARWIVGRYELLIRRAPELARCIAHRPIEGLAWLVEIFGRPLSLTIPLRLGTGALLVLRGRVVAGSVIAGSTLIDLSLFAGRTSPRAALRLAASWLVAAAMIPRALLRWTKVERR